MEFVLNDEVQDEAGFLELLSSDLKPFYEPRLPYHNWDEHIEQGLGIIGNLCEQEKAKATQLTLSWPRWLTWVMTLRST